MKKRDPYLKRRDPYLKKKERNYLKKREVELKEERDNQDSQRRKRERQFEARRRRGRGERGRQLKREELHDEEPEREVRGPPYCLKGSQGTWEMNSSRCQIPPPHVRSSTLSLPKRFSREPSSGVWLRLSRSPTSPIGCSISGWSPPSIRWEKENSRNSSPKESSLMRRIPRWIARGWYPNNVLSHYPRTYSSLLFQGKIQRFQRMLRMVKMMKMMRMMMMMIVRVSERNRGGDEE